jgi:nitroreductase
MINPEQHLNHLFSRRSVRNFSDRPVGREVLERVMTAATSAPSPTNRQPWRFSVVTSHERIRQISEAIRARADEIKTIIRRGHHADDFGNYSDFFHEPIQNATVVIVPQYRQYPDLIANLIASGGEDPKKFHTAASMQAELCCTSAAVMALLLQAHVEGLGACWMAGPMIAKPEIVSMLEIREPYRMMGAIALGWPQKSEAPKPRNSIDDVVKWWG